MAATRMPYGVHSAPRDGHPSHARRDCGKSRTRRARSADDHRGRPALKKLLTWGSWVLMLSFGVLALTLDSIAFGLESTSAGARATHQLDHLHLLLPASIRSSVYLGIAVLGLCCTAAIGAIEILERDRQKGQRNPNSSPTSEGLKHGVIVSWVLCVFVVALTAWATQTAQSRAIAIVAEMNERIEPDSRRVLR